MQPHSTNTTALQVISVGESPSHPTRAVLEESTSWDAESRPLLDDSTHPASTSSSVAGKGQLPLSRNGGNRSSGGGGSSGISIIPGVMSTYFGKYEMLVAGAAYCLVSALVILVNKHVLASFGFTCPVLLLCFQCAVAVVLVKTLEPVLSVKVEKLSRPLVTVWLPANLLFVGMMVTSFYSLQIINVGTFTVLKNLANLLMITGDYFVFGYTYDMKVWLCLLLMALSALCSGLTDMRFNALGYTWQIINCFFTAGYTLYLSVAMAKASALTHDQLRMNEISMVYYNNILSVPLLMLLALGRGEVQALSSQQALRDPAFLFAAMLTALLGFGMSFTSLWYLSRATATIFSLTGSLNKILVAVAGLIVFAEPTSIQNLASIGVGLAAGVAFGLAKTTARRAPAVAATIPVVDVPNVSAKT